MMRLTPAQTAALQHWFVPEEPRLLIGAHVIAAGCGECWVDSRPAPRALLAETGGNYLLLGDAQALTPDDLRPLVKGFVDADEAFAPLIRAAFPEVQVWPRVALAQPDPGSNPGPETGPDVAGEIAGAGVLRRLGSADAAHLAALEPGSAWISKTWGGPQGLANSGYAWGAFVDGRLAAVACTFFLGRSYEEIGVVTVPALRRLGLGAACAAALCRDIRGRGHAPGWTTSPDNLGSLGIARKLGFQEQRRTAAYVVGIEIPA